MTRVGWTTIAAGVVLTALGWMLVWPSIAVLGVGSVLLVAGALACTIRRPRVQITREIQPARVQKGDTAIVFLTLANTGRRGVAPMVIEQPYGDTTVRARLPRLRRGERGMTTFRLPTTRRGVFTLGPLELTRADPFAIARITQRHCGDDLIWVHPRVMPFSALPSGVTRHLEGPTADTAPQGDITFHRLREYVMGDDLRMIHWKSTARVGQLMVRHNVDTSQPLTVVVFDQRPDRYSAESFETAVDAAASVVVAATGGRAPAQLRTTTGDQVGDPSRSEPQAILDHLTTVDPAPGGALADVLLRLRRERGGTALVVVTGAVDEAELPTIASLRTRFQRVVVVSVTPAAQAPPAFAGIDIVTGSDEETLTRAWNLGVRR